MSQIWLGIVSFCEKEENLKAIKTKKISSPTESPV